MRIFQDRKEAGKELAKKLQMYQNQSDVIVIGLPRGGVVVAAEIAESLRLPLDIIVTRKIPAEGDSEYAIGAVTETGKTIWNKEEKSRSREIYLKQIVEQEHKEALRRLKTYRGNRSVRKLQDQVVILVDDGIATGLTMKAAIQTAKQEGAKKIVVAVPHGAQDTILLLQKEVDEVVVLEQPEFYISVGSFYEDFPQTTDEEVIAHLKEKQP